MSIEAMHKFLTVPIDYSYKEKYNQNLNSSINPKNKMDITKLDINFRFLNFFEENSKNYESHINHNKRIFSRNNNKFSENLNNNWKENIFNLKIHLEKTLSDRIKLFSKIDNLISEFQSDNYPDKLSCNVYYNLSFVNNPIIVNSININSLLDINQVRNNKMQHIRTILDKNISINNYNSSSNCKIKKKLKSKRC